MLKHTIIRFGLLITLAIVIVGCGNLAGDVEIVATTAPESAPIPDAEGNIINPPAEAPNLLNGQRIFAANCTECHNTNGDGGGELVQSGEVPRMPSFLEATHVREQSPEFYFDIITNGNLANLMPPWVDALTEQERWDVAMYVYTLHYTPEQVQQGADAYPDAPQDFSLESDAALLGDVSQATGLTDDAAWAAVAYQRVRSLRNYGLVNNVEIAGLQDDTPPPDIMIFSGTVAHGTTGFTVPPGSEVILRYGNFGDGFETATTTIDANNTYQFENIPYAATNFYLTTVQYNGVVFQSDILSPQNLAENNDLPITIYERTESAADILLTNIDIQVDRTTVDGMGSGLVFRQVNTYTNNSEYVLYRSPQNQDISVSLLVQLPPGALILNDTQNPRYIIAQDFYSLIDTNPVYPGEHIVEAVYFLPHTDGEAVIDLEMSNRFEGNLNIAMAVPSMSISGEGIAAAGEETIQTNEGSVVVQNYQGTYAIPTGESLVFVASGSLLGSQNTSADAAVVTSNFLIPVIIFVVALFAFAIIGLVIARRRFQNTSGDNQRDIDRLLAQIAQLEAMHEKGEINHDVFQRQRKELKDKLAPIMRNSTTNNDD